jgi:hypothetical protein
LNRSSAALLRAQTASAEADIQRIVEAQVIPALQKLPGFQRYIGGINRSTGMLTAVSLWDSEEQASFSREAVISAIPALTALGVTFEPAETYEVTADA